MFSLFAVLTSSLYGKEVSVSAKTTEKNWYLKVLSSDKGTYRAPHIAGYTKKNSLGNKTVYRKNFTNYALLDINKDGVKELLLSEEPNGFATVVVLTYYKKKVKPLYIFDSVRAISYKNKKLIYECGTSSENTCRVFELKKGKMRAILNAFHTTSSIYDVPIYRLNGKKCSEKVFYKKYNRYTDNAEYISFGYI